MKVPDQFSQKIARISGSQRTVGGKKASAPGGASFDQQFLQDLTKAAQGDDAVRESRVHALKEQIAQGTYHVSATDLADSMLRGFQTEKGTAPGGQSVEDLADALFRQNLQPNA